MIKKDVDNLKSRITTMVMEARKKDQRTARPYVPRYVSVDSIIQQDGGLLRRLKIILVSNGCSVPTCTMCPFTNENNYGLRENADQAMLDQVREALEESKRDIRPDCIALYNDGSFFAPHELSENARRAIAEMVAESGVSLLTVESLPQFITEDRLLPFLDALGGVMLEIGLGLQSAHPIVRELCVNTSFDNATFEHTVNLLLRHNVRVKTYVMLKPPFLTEEEAVTDAVNTIAYCQEIGIPYVTLCPTRIAPHTLAWDLMKAGVYEPPNLWSIVDTARRASQDVTLRVACINLRDEDFTSVFPNSCPSCADYVIDALQSFSIGVMDALNIPRCTCTPHEVEPVPQPESSVLFTRIKDTLDAMPVRKPAFKGVALKHEAQL